MPKHRPKLAGRIRELASKDVLAAMMLAHRGKQFDELQSFLSLYYQTLEKAKQIESGIKTRDQELLEISEKWTDQVAANYCLTIQRLLREDLNRLCEMFISAVDNRDAEKIAKISKAVKFMREFKESGDGHRANILMFKNILDKRGEKWTVRKLASVIGWPMEDSVNGFFKLRRMANGLHFPLKASTQISDD